MGEKSRDSFGCGKNMSKALERDLEKARLLKLKQLELLKKR